MLLLMKLVLAVIQDADAAALMRALSEQHFEATKLASTGGFLREGNTTLMIGVDDQRLDTLRTLIGQTCRSRTGSFPHAVWSAKAKAASRRSRSRCRWAAQ